MTKTEVHKQNMTGGIEENEHERKSGAPRDWESPVPYAATFNVISRNFVTISAAISSA